MTDHLLVDHQDGISTLTMNRPEVLNALSMDMRHAMFDAMDAIEHDPKVRCVVLRGAGGNFMAGGDVKSFAEDYAHLPAAERQAIFERRIHSLHPMMMQMRRMKKPMLASVRKETVFSQNKIMGSAWIGRHCHSKAQDKIADHALSTSEE